MLSTLAISLALTLAIEVPVAAFWGARGRTLLLCVLVNLLTNPAAVLLHNLFPPVWFLLVLEGAAIAVEGGYYRRYAEGIARPWALAVSANLLSWSVGNLLNKWF